MIKKRQGIYHCDFSVNGQRFRLTLETADWREARRKESDYKARAQSGQLAGGQAASWARLGFEEAMTRYLAERKIELRRPEFYDFISRPLLAYFRGRRLNQISTEDVKAYRALRCETGRQPQTANHEVGLLLRLMKRAKLRHLVGDEVKPLPIVEKQRQMLTAVEKQHLFEVAASKPAWQTAFCAALLTANTTLRPVELKRLLWRDLDPINRELSVWRSKSEAGTRSVPLNDEAWSAIAVLKRWADRLGTYAPDYYIFHRQKPKIDPTRPMWSWRSAWRSLRKAAGMPNLRFYDLRHQAVTEMLEAGVPEGVIREIAGHVDPGMTRHYSHPRRLARRAAVEALATVKTGAFTGGYGTNDVTKALPAKTEALQVVDSNGRDGQI